MFGKCGSTCPQGPAQVDHSGPTTGKDVTVLETPDRAKTVSGQETSVTQKVKGKQDTDNGIFVEGTVSGLTIDFLIDSGSSATLLSHELYKTLPAEGRAPLHPVRVELKSVNGDTLRCYGKTEVDIALGSSTFKQTVIVCDIDLDAILGQDFILEHVNSIDLKHMRLLTPKTDIPCFLGGKFAMVCRVYAKETVTIPPQSVMNVPVQVPKCNRLSDIVLFEPTPDVIEKRRLLLTPSVTGDKAQPIAMVVNLSDTERVLYPNTYLGVCQSAEEADEKDAKRCAKVEAKFSARSRELPDYLQDLFRKSSVHLTAEQALRLKDSLIRFQHIFAKSPDDMGCTDKAKHKIDTLHSKPIRQQMRRQPLGKREAEKEEVKTMLDRNIIEPSSSAWASPVVLVTKKDGSVRFCVDYRKLNDVTVKDAYPLPRVDDCLDALAGSTMFSTMDLQSGFWQVPLASEEDKQKTAFTTGLGLFQFTIMCFGLTNAPATFQRLMENVLQGLQWEECVLFMDDTIVPSADFDEGLDRLERVWQRFDEANLKLKPSKCLLFQREIKFLGHVVSAQGVKTDPDKVSTVKEWPVPKSAKQVRSFLGLCSYYRRFVKGFADIARPLHKLCEKRGSFHWSEQAQTAFETLKQKLTSTPVLGYPLPNLPFTLDTDASDEAVGAVLSQIQDGQERVVAYMSRSLNRAETSYCVTRKELLAVVLSLKHFHPYLYGQEVLLRTDNAAVSWMRNLKNPQGQVARWLEEMGNYNLHVTHRPGAVHRNADALSRRPCHSCSKAQASELTDEQSCLVHEPGEVVESVDVTPKFGKSTEIKVNATKQSDATVSDTNVDINQPSCSSWPDNQPQRLTQKSAESKTCEFKVKSASRVLEGWEPEALRNTQMADENIGPIFRAREAGETRLPWIQVSSGKAELKSLWATWDRLLIIDGVLYRRRAGDEKQGLELQIVVPAALRPQVMKHHHDIPTAGHLSAEKTLDKMKFQFFWPSMKESVHSYCLNCDLCTARKTPKGQTHAPLGQYLVGEPMERIALDILGPLPLTEQNNKYVLVVVDLFTKWTEAYPLPDQEARTIVTVFVNEFICRYGTPLQIITDQGKNFESNVFKEVCDLLQIDKTRTTSYHPQANGTAERFNRTLATMLTTYCETKQRMWDVYLPQVMMAYRSSPNSATHQTPNKMVFGRDVTLPMQAVTGRPTEAGEAVSPTQYVLNLHAALEQAHDHARTFLHKASSYQKRHYDLKAHKKSFSAGQAVWLHHPVRKRGVCQKLTSSWKGPFLVTKKLDDLTYMLKKSASALPKAHHIDRLMAYQGVRQPKWMQ